MPYHDHQLPDLPVYADWSPTKFDCRGLGLEDKQNWRVCPVCVTRDTPEHSIDASNYAVMLRELEKIDPEGLDHEEHSFNHWGPGWFDIILVRPESACEQVARESAAAIADYPLLDEHDHSEREFHAACEAWEGLDLRDRIRICAKHGVSIFAARRDDLPQGLNHHEDLIDRC